MPVKMNSTTKRAIEAFAANPKTTSKDVAKKCGITKSAASNIRFKYKNEIKEGRHRLEQNDGGQMELDLSQFPTVEELAHKITCGAGREPSVDDVVNERAITYGKFENLAEVSQRFKDSLHYFLITRNKYLAPDQQEAMELIFHKFARIVNGDPDHVDNWKDVAGYATLVADRLEGNPR
tara:strand:- start:431 stop:967 length:537 start_codon:yes stop_codon:yes gene_type:complete